MLENDPTPDPEIYAKLQNLTKQEKRWLWCSCDFSWMNRCALQAFSCTSRVIEFGWTGTYQRGSSPYDWSIGSRTGFRTEELILESFLSHWSDRSHHIGVRNRSHCRHHFTTLGCGIILSLWKRFSCHWSKATIASRTGTGTVRIFFSSWQFFAIGCCCKDTKRLPQLHPSTFHFIWGGWEESFWTTHHGQQLWWASTSSWSGTAGNCGGRASACPWGGTASTPANGREWIRPHGLPGLTGQSGDIAGKI